MDRLNELRKGAEVGAGDDDDIEGGNLVSNEEKVHSAGTELAAGVSSTAGGMEGFFQTVDAIKDDILFIKHSTTEILQLNSTSVQATTSAQEKLVSDRLHGIVGPTNKRAGRTKSMLKQMKEETESLKSGDKLKSSEVRIRENLCTTLTRKYVEVMKEYQSIQTQYRADIKKKVTRQVQIVKTDATPEEIDAVIKSGGTDQVFRSAILSNASDPVQSALLFASEKYQDVLTLEASVSELHQMILDFCLLVEAQGELLDQIEFQVRSAADFIEDGSENVKGAVEISKSILKWKCCICVLVLVILGIVILAVVLTFQPKK